MRFDDVAADYKQLVDQAVGISGEETEYFAEYKARYLSRLGPDFSGRALDFGCGVGMLSGRLKAHLPEARLDGYDVSDRSLERVDPRLRAQGMFTSDSGALGHDYALIVVANVLHHVPPPERSGLIRQLRDRLAPTGRLAIFEHNPANPLTRLVVERCVFDHDAILLPPAETAAHQAEVGLRLVRRDYIVFLPRFLAWLRFCEPWLAWLPLGAQYVIVGTRDA